MTRDEITKLAQEAELLRSGEGWTEPYRWGVSQIEHFADLVIEHDRKELEEKLLKLKNGVASVSQYIQGRWDLIGEFQDILREKP
jgi:hypothetical protein